MRYIKVVDGPLAGEVVHWHGGIWEGRIAPLTNLSDNSKVPYRYYEADNVFKLDITSGAHPANQNPEFMGMGEPRLK